MPSSQTVPAQQFPHHPLNGDSLVETQNLASHEEVSTKRDNHNVLTVGAFVARETQDFASLLGWCHHFSTRIYHMLNVIDNDAASLIHRNAAFSIHDSSYSSPFIAHTVTFLSM